jgi:hypothetical protein
VSDTPYVSNVVFFSKVSKMDGYSNQMLNQIFVSKNISDSEGIF